MPLAPRSCRLPIHLLLLCLVSIALAKSVNRTIDDEFGDEVTGHKLAYYSTDRATWKTGNTCTDCFFNNYIDPSRIFRGTWKDLTRYPDHPDTPSVTARFSGTAVYVYAVLIGYPLAAEAHIGTFLDFELDGALGGAFSREQFSGVTYRAPVYARDGLADGPHTLVISVPAGRDGNWSSVVLFDYIEYTMSDPSPPNIDSSSLPLPISTSSPSPTSSSNSSPGEGGLHISGRLIGVIVGGTLAGAMVLILSVLALAYLVRRGRASGPHPVGRPLFGWKSNPRPTSPSAITPFARQQPPSRPILRDAKAGRTRLASPLSAAMTLGPEAVLYAEARMVPAVPEQRGQLPPSPNTDGASPGGALSPPIRVSHARDRPVRERGIAATLASSEEARLSALEHQMTRMRALIDAPPEYESEV